MTNDARNAGDSRRGPLTAVFGILLVPLLALWMFQAATGVLLTYHFELNDALLSRAEIALDYDAIETRIDRIQEGGKAKVNWIWSTAGLPGRFLLNYTDGNGQARAARIAGDGSVLLDTPAGELTFLESVRALHLELAAGRTGELILAFSGIVLLGYLALSFVRAWRRPGPGDAPGPGSSGRASTLFLHLSRWGALPAFVVVLAAVVIYFEHQIEGPIGAHPIALPANPPAGAGAGFAAAVRAAEAAIPGSRFVGTPMPTAEDASYKTWVNQPGEMFREDGYGGSLVIVDANDASVRGAWPLQEASAPYVAIALPYPVHTGEIARPVGRILVLLIGVWLLAWAATALYLRLGPAPGLK